MTRDPLFNRDLLASVLALLVYAVCMAIAAPFVWIVKKLDNQD